MWGPKSKPTARSYTDADYSTEKKANKRYDQERKELKALKSDRPFNGKQSENIKSDESRATAAKKSKAVADSIGFK